jgi:type IV pilus assembly protein PilA
MQTCSRCSSSIQDGVSFCPACGNSLPAVAGSPGSRTGVSPSISAAYAGPQQTSGKPIGSFLCGLFCWLLPVTVVAIILGHLSLSDIKKSAGRLKGQGLAVAGLVLGYMGVLFIPFILIIAAIAIPNLLRARMAANEATAVGTLRTYNTAMVTYASQCQNIGFPASVTNLGAGSGDCEGANLVGALLAAPATIKSGYRFFYSPGPADNLGHVVSYTITADPITENTTGIRHFFTDESGVIHISRGAPATADSPALQ